MIDGGGAVVAAIGAVCSLGYDAPTAFAAARAQVSRASVQSHFRVRSDVEGVEEPVTGHSADLLTAGFELEGRLLRLAQAALQDLLTGGLDAEVWRQPTGFYLALPDRARVRSGRPLSASNEEGDADADEDTATDDSDAAAAAGSADRHLLARALAGAAWPARPARLRVWKEGHVAGAKALATASDDLRVGAVQVAVVLAVDSLLDEDTLTWLHSCGRLKCDAAPTGLRPGEGAVALALLPSAGDANSPLAQRTRLARVSLDSEPKAQVLGSTSTGESLSRVLGLAWQGEPARSAWLLSDHNGEHYRANDWGCALARLRSEHQAFAEPQTWFPALAFGDTGAASALFAVGMVWQAQQRSHAPSKAALIASAADDGGRAAILLHLD